MMEEYTFSSAQETALPQGLKVAPVKMDEEGLLPESLDEVLSNWDESARGARKPFVLYTIPTGQNPTGATQQAERRKAVYKVAQKHDVYIVEDEPYYFLQMQPYAGADGEPVPPPANHEEFIKSLIPSYLSLDTDGRVLRLESFSKVLAPGSRVGWAVGSEQIIERFTRTCETSSQNPSGISQLVLYKLLEEQWGHAGYLDWLINLLQSFPESFIPHDQGTDKKQHWIEIDWRKHPGLSSGKTREEIEEEVFQAAVNNGVLISRGSWFKAQGASEEKLFFRATFAAASSDAIAEAISRFGTTLRQEFGLN
ncbi:unnamed protein product [Aspergillus oryzae]|uniref:Unnamed protein product n=2 Tax=Aspergillus oryzae TaxID=5062 RepID=A0AAN4YRM2_ASPOZ|nr:unnamed protein product [Aspergillus oryzae]GMF90656.1 unnamed protein product [Aspergillus oryzae]GMG02721.1 unnamed protein product [Aspergillus oryzae]GMG33547.1 unnamed protein product [Aspergillus oryzae]GMG48501.1 unnamed protein product [Aspergillus oryzae var. brunneus]